MMMIRLNERSGEKPRTQSREVIENILFPGVASVICDEIFDS